MGYEVLGDRSARDADDGGDTGAAHTGPASAVEVFPLDGDHPPPEPRMGTGAVLAKAWQKALRTRPHLVVAVVTVLALALGAVVGTETAHRRERAARAAAEQRQLTVLAEATSVAQDLTESVRLTIQLSNLGPRPVTLVETPQSGSPGLGRPVIRPAIATADGRPLQVAPGRQGLVIVSTALNCDADGVPPAWPPVSVRTENGEVHQVQVRPASLEAVGAPYACERFAEEQIQLQAELTGTRTDPVLAVTSTADDPRQLFVNGPSTDSGDRTVTIQTRPALPVAIQPGERILVHLSLVVTRCIRDLPARQSLLGQQGSVLAHLGDSNAGTPVDVTVLVADALDRACA